MALQYDGFMARKRRFLTRSTVFLPAGAPAITFSISFATIPARRRALGTATKWPLAV